jgi:hypothetical protein
VGTWHADNEVSSTYVDWRPDHTCINKHIITQGTEIDTTSDVCTWTFTRLGPHTFAIDWKSKVLDEGFGKHLEFEIESPLRAHNTTMHYDAFKIVCPAQEIQLRQRQLTALRRRADANPGNVAYRDDLGAGFETLGQALDQSDRPQEALAAFTGELATYQQLANRDSANVVWRQRLGGAQKDLGDFHMGRFRAAHSRKPSDNAGAVTELQTALAAYQADLNIRTQFVAAAPTDLAALRAEALANMDMGVAMSWYQFAQCQKYFLENVRILEKVAAANPTSAQDSEALLQAWATLGSVSQGPAKKAALNGALQVAQAMERNHQLSEGTAGAVETLRQEIAALDTAK